MATGDTLVEGFQIVETTSFDMQPQYKTRLKLWFVGQTVSTVASTVANQGVGAVAIPALSAGATGNLTITNSLIVATSFVFCQVKRGTTTAGAGAVGTVLAAARLPGAGSCVVDVTNLGSAATLSTDYELWFLIIN